MNREWKDPRDNREWEVEAFPMTVPIEPGKPIPRFDQVNHRVRFTSSDMMESCVGIVPAEVGMRFKDLTDAEMADLLDMVRGRAGG